MNKKQQKQFDAMTRKLVKQRKTTYSWWNLHPLKVVRKIRLAEMRQLWKDVAQFHKTVDTSLTLKKTVK